MTVLTTAVSAGPYSGNGSTTVFPFAFGAATPAEVRVLVNGIEAPPSYYLVDADFDGGAITFLSPPPSGTIIQMFAVPDFRQTVTFENHQTFFPSVMNDVHDREAMRSIYLLDAVGRSLRVPPGESFGALPALADRASKVLGFGLDGAPIAMVPGGVQQDASTLPYLLSGTGTYTRSAASVFGERISVLNFIPIALHSQIRSATCAVDLTPYINAAIDFVDAVPGLGTLVFPYGAYKVTEINCAKSVNVFDRKLRLLGEGATIEAFGSDTVLLNNSGRNGMCVQDLKFSSAGYRSQCAIFTARTVASPNANGNQYINVHCNGYFSKGTVVSLGAESTTWLACKFQNVIPDALALAGTGLGAYRCFVMGLTNALLDAAIQVTPANGGALATGGSPSTDNVMTDCEFYCAGQGAMPRTPMVLSTSVGLTLFGGTFVPGAASNTKFVVLTKPNGGVWNGPLTLYECHYEAFGANNSVIYLDAPNGTSYWNGINVIGGSIVADLGIVALDYDRANVAIQPILQASRWDSPTVPNGSNVDPTIFAYGMVDCSIRWKVINGFGGVVVPGFTSRTGIDSNNIALAQSLGGDTSLFSAGLPAAGTFAVGQQVRNTTAAVGSPANWVCTSRGTRGTLAGVTAATAAGTNAVTFNIVTGVREGQWINIAGSGSGPQFIVKLAGSVGYMATNCNNTVAGAAVTLSAPVLTADNNLLVNVGGTAAFTAATTVVVPLTGEPDANYRIALTQYASSPLPPWITAKTAGGFTINFSAAFTGNVDWTLSR